jgi:uncharacterized membrane protein
MIVLFFLNRTSLKTGTNDIMTMAFNMHESTMGIIAALIIGGFLLYQDFTEIEPFDTFSFSGFIWTGIILIMGSIIAFVITLIIKNNAKKSSLNA